MEKKFFKNISYQIFKDLKKKILLYTTNAINNYCFRKYLGILSWVISLIIFNSTIVF